MFRPAAAPGFPSSGRVDRLVRPRDDREVRRRVDGTQPRQVDRHGLWRGSSVHKHCQMFRLRNIALLWLDRTSWSAVRPTAQRRLRDRETTKR